MAAATFAGIQTSCPAANELTRHDTRSQPLAEARLVVRVVVAGEIASLALDVGLNVRAVVAVERVVAGQVAALPPDVTLDVRPIVAVAALLVGHPCTSGGRERIG